MKFTLIATILTIAAAIAVPSASAAASFRCLGPTEDCPQIVPCCLGTACSSVTHKCVPKV